MRHRSIHFYFIFLFYLLFPQSIAFGASKPIVLFSYNNNVYTFKETKELGFKSISNYIKPSNSSHPDKALTFFLDSLGFFNPSFDTLGTDTIQISANKRSYIESIQIQGTNCITFDSIALVKFSLPYNAGLTGIYAQKTLSWFLNHGYCFASLSISLIPGKNNNSLIVIYNVKENGRFVFSKPLFTGTFKTSRTLLSHDIVFKEGEYFSLLKVEMSRKKLLSRPYISEVSVSAPVALLDVRLSSDTGSDVMQKTPGNPSVAPQKDKVLIPFACTDKQGLGLDGALTFSAGGQSAASGFFGIANITLLNLLHSGEACDISYKGQLDFTRFALSLSKPYLFNTPFSAGMDFGMELKKDDYGYIHGGLETQTEFSSLWQIGLGFKGHEVLDTSGATSNYGGVEIILEKTLEKIQANEFVTGLELKTGSGLATNMGRQFDRWHVDVTGYTQFPFTLHHAATCRIVGQTIFTQPQDTLRSVELYRTGGYKSVRGYSDYEFAFQTVCYSQFEYLYYFNTYGALYAFADMGLGFNQNTQWQMENGIKMLGYGLGIKIPVKIGTAKIEWARNYQESKGLGRIHISIQNPISTAMGN